MAKFQYSRRVTGGLSAHLRQDIVSAIESDKALRDEIRRVFQQANRRIQNVQHSGLFSPALTSLGDLMDRQGFSKFSMGGKSWQELKRDYAKAVAFLNQPTSSATGAREYGKQIQSRYNLTADAYNKLMAKVTDNLGTLKGDFVERYFKRYKDFTGEFEEAAKSSSSMMEQDAAQLEQAIQQQIDSAADQVTGQVNKVLGEFFDATGGFTIDI